MCTIADVTRFGANGDGNVDDTAAFQAAVDSLRGNAGRIVCPAEPLDNRGQPHSNPIA